jgi:hypothetical protein
VRNIFVDERTAKDIDHHIDRIHRDLDYVGGKVELPQVRELLRLDIKYYQADDPDLIEQVIHKLKVGGKQVLKRPKLLLEAVRKFDLNALFIPDSKRILIDYDVPDLKKRWCESHEMSHSVIPWHGDYMFGDNRSTLSQSCHQTIEAEANYGAGRLLFPNESFAEARRASDMTLAYTRNLAKHFGNTITSTLWRCVEQSEELMFAAIGEHPLRPREGKQMIEYIIRSKVFSQQFRNVTEPDVWTWLQGYCTNKAAGPLGSAEIMITDVNGTRHAFIFETFSTTYSVLTLARWSRSIEPIVIV